MKSNAARLAVDHSIQLAASVDSDSAHAGFPIRYDTEYRAQGTLDMRPCGAIVFAFGESYFAFPWEGVNFSGGISLLPVDCLNREKIRGEYEIRPYAHSCCGQSPL